MIDSRFRILKDGVSYNVLFENVELECQSCSLTVNKVSYSERTGVGEWICQNKHLSRGVIGV